MPAPGSTYNLPNRDQSLDKNLWKEYKLKYNSDISFEQFSAIIKESNKKIAHFMLEDQEGFKLPENLGYLCVVKYKTKRKAINWADTKKYGKTIYYLNLHSFGYRYHIKWYKTGISRFAFNEVYKFAPLRVVKTDVSRRIKAGADYVEWNLKDFWDSKKIDKILNKQALKSEKQSKHE